MKKILSFILLGLLCSIGMVWGETTTGTYTTRVIKNANDTSVWSFDVVTGSAVSLAANTLTTDNEMLFISNSSAGNIKFQTSSYISCKGESSIYIPVPAGSAGVVSHTVSSSSDSRYFQLFVNGTAGTEGQRLYSKYNATITADGKKGPQSFSFTSSDITTYEGKTYLHLKDNNTEMKIASITVALTAGTYAKDPFLSVAPSTANSFTYVVNNGPSAVQTFTVSGSNLTDNDITVSLNAGSEYYEISSDNIAFGSSNLVVASGASIFVRLKAGLALGGAYAGTLRFANDGADNVDVTLAGSVTGQTYAITYDLNGATGTTPTEADKIEGATFTLHNGKTGITAPDGKMFAGWNDGTSTYDGGDTYTMGNTAVTLTAQWTRLCGELIKAVHTGKTTATVTGVVGGTVDKSIASDGKFGGKGQYFGITLASGTFKTGDILNVNLTTAGAQGSIAVYADKDGANLLYDTESLGAVGNNNFDLPAAINGKSTIYICRTLDESNKWNGYVNYISVTRSCLVTPSITTQPAAEQMVLPNASVTLSVVAAAGDGGALSYQWYYCTDANKTGASEIDGATNASYSPSTAVLGTYYYYCKVTEAGADAPIESNVAKVVVASSVYTVAYYNNPASAALGSEEVPEGDHPADYATYEAPTAVFTKFDGWYTNSNLEAQYKVADMSAYVVNADVNFYGKWVKAYSETFDFEAYALADGSEKSTIGQMDNAYLAYGLVNDGDLDNNTSTNNGAYVGFKLKKSGAYIAALVPAGKMFIIKMGAVASESDKKPQMLINGEVDGVLTGGSTSSGDNFKNYVYVNNTGMDVQYKIQTQSNATVVIKKISIVDGYARTELTANNWGTICLPYAVAAENYMGAKFYEPVDADASSITVAEVSALVAGKPYLFKATDTKLYAWWYSGDAAAAGENNGLHGNLAADPVAVPVGSYILSNNQFREVQGGTVTVAQNRAYLTWSEVQTANAAPGRGLVRIPLEENNATAVENIEAGENVKKFFENGRLFILRDGVVYDATGKMIK